MKFPPVLNFSRLCKKIARKKYEYTLVLQNNHPTIHEEIKTLFNGGLDKSSRFYETDNKKHDRIEKQIYYLNTDASRLFGVKGMEKSEII